MLTALKINNHPYFDITELEPERDLIVKVYRPLNPIKTGDRLPDFSLEKESSRWQQFFNGAEIQGPVLFRQLLNKPLVIGFYSHHWQQHGLDLLQQLNNIQHDIKVQGGQLLIITPKKERALEKIAWDNHLSLSFYFDKDNEIAEKFNIYSEYDPIWNKFSGIDTNVPLLATYVVSQSGQIAYDHIDPEFSKKIPAKDIVAAISKYNIIS